MEFSHRENFPIFVFVYFRLNFSLFYFALGTIKLTYSRIPWNFHTVGIMLISDCLPKILYFVHRIRFVFSTVFLFSVAHIFKITISRWKYFRVFKTFPYGGAKTVYLKVRILENVFPKFFFINIERIRIPLFFVKKIRSLYQYRIYNLKS